MPRAGARHTSRTHPTPPERSAGTEPGTEPSTVNICGTYCSIRIRYITFPSVQQSGISVIAELDEKAVSKLHTNITPVLIFLEKLCL